MKSLYFLFFVSLPGLFLGQGGFTKRHFLPAASYAVCRDVVEAPNGNLIAIGVILDTLSNEPRLLLLGMNAGGDTLWSKKYGGTNLRFFDNDLYFRAPLVCDSSGIYLALVAWDGIHPRTFGVLMKCDYGGNTLWQKKLISSDTLEDVMPQGICKSQDGGLLLTGAFQWWGATATLKTLVLKTDINGNELWRKKITKAVPEVQDGKAIVQDKSSKKIVIAGYQYIGNSNFWYCFGNILILDSVGNKIVQTTYTQPDAGVFVDLIQTKDGHFITCGMQSANNMLGNLDRYRSLLVKFNLNGVKLWSKEYDQISFMNSANQILELPNEDLLMSGYLDTMVNHNINEEVMVKVFRLDKNGNEKWRRNIGARFNDEQPMSLHPTKDGGFVLGVREIFGSITLPYNIIKIDSNGCDNSEAYCKYLDALGLSEIHINHLSFFPNPADDLISIMINSSSAGFFTAEISDVSGRKIEEIVLEGNLENQVSLNSYAPGAYTVKILLNNKSVETRKLVIVR